MALFTYGIPPKYSVQLPVAPNQFPLTLLFNISSASPPLAYIPPKRYSVYPVFTLVILLGTVSSYVAKYGFIFCINLYFSTLESLSAFCSIKNSHELK